MKKRQGFTLMELSIVLIVIGVLTGFVLKGQGVIRNAKLKRIASDFSNVSAAIYTYEDRYEQLPGDDGSSVIAVSMGHKGNEDGIISASESGMVLKHLRKAGLLHGDYDSSALQHALNGQIHVVQGNDLGGLKSGEGNLQHMSGTAVCFDNVNTEDAQLLDLQNDDGVFNKGSVQAAKAYFDLDALVSICFEI